MSLDLYFMCPTCGDDDDEESWLNITHNMSSLAKEVGVYDCLWGAEENGFKESGDLIKPLSIALYKLKNEEQIVKDPDNGWGSKEGFIYFIETALKKAVACPNLKIKVSK